MPLFVFFDGMCLIVVEKTLSLHFRLNYLHKKKFIEKEKKTQLEQQKKKVDLLIQVHSDFFISISLSVNNFKTHTFFCLIITFGYEILTWWCKRVEQMVVPLICSHKCVALKNNWNKCKWKIWKIVKYETKATAC